MTAGVMPQTLDSVLGECYRLAVLKGDHAGAVTYLSSEMRDDAALASEATAYKARYDALNASTGGSAHRRCYMTYIQAKVIIDAEAVLRAEGEQP